MRHLTPCTVIARAASDRSNLSCILAPLFNRCNRYRINFFINLFEMFFLALFSGSCINSETPITKAKCIGIG